MLSHTRDICTVSLHCEFYCAVQAHAMLQILCYKQYIQTVSLLNGFVCVLLALYYSYNICHILCTCIYLYEYTYGHGGCSEMNTFSRTEDKNTRFLLCVFYYGPSHHILL